MQDERTRGTLFTFSCSQMARGVTRFREGPPKEARGVPPALDGRMQKQALKEMRPDSAFICKVRSRIIYPSL